MSNAVMSNHVKKRPPIRSAYSSKEGVQDIVDDLVTQLGGGSDAALVFVFTSHQVDGAKVTGLLAQQWKDADVIGCTTAGEFTEQHSGSGGVSALMLPRGIVRRTAAEIAGFRKGTRTGVDAAVERLEDRLGRQIRDLEPSSWVGFVLIDGTHGAEEETNLRLGQLSPYLSFVGGSAGDGLEFERTRVFCNGKETDHGAVLVLAELAVPHSVLKTCSFAPQSAPFVVTRADPATRTVYEIDGKPVRQAYAEALGLTPEQLDDSVFMRHPWGLMIDGDPWIRSPQRFLPDGGLKFYCQLPQGTVCQVMANQDMIRDTGAALRELRGHLGGHVSGAILFDCVLRRLEMDAENLHQPFLDLLGDTPSAGFHTYGESWLGHITQTCVGVLFG